MIGAQGLCVSVPHLHQQSVNATRSFDDEFAGAEFSVELDARNQKARIVNDDGSEIPTTTAFWFAGHAVHPETSALSFFFVLTVPLHGIDESNVSLVQTPRLV